MALLNWCCCCLPLRGGALAIAITYLVVNVSLLLGCGVWFLALLAQYISFSSPDDLNSHHYFEMRFAGVIFGSLSLLCGINITMDSLLVHDIRKNQRKFMLPWVVWYGIFKTLVTIALLGTCIWLLVLYFQLARRPSEGSAIIMAIFITISSVAGLSLPVMWYWYACVASYYALCAKRRVLYANAARWGCRRTSAWQPPCKECGLAADGGAKPRY